MSARAKEAIKTALAMAIAYGVSLAMGWENPYWAGFAVAMISLSTIGQSLNKGTMRMLGTFLAAIVALTLIALFSQERWWYVAALSLYLGFCTYMITGKKRTYFWWCSAFVCLVISVHAAADLTNAFDTAVLRAQQTGMGILVYTLVSVLLWPTSTRGALEDVTRKLFATQAKLYRTYFDILEGNGTGEDLRPTRFQELQLLSQHQQTLQGAQTDSYEVWEMRRQWWRFHDQSRALMETLEQWRASFPEVQSLDIGRLLQNRKAVHDELTSVFEQIERMLNGEAPTRYPQPVNFDIDKAALDELNHFQKAAVAVAKTELARIDELGRALFDCVCRIKGHEPKDSGSLPESVERKSTGVDLDRLQAVFKVMVTVWAAFAIWFYVNPSGHESFVELAAIFVMASAMMRFDPATVVVPFLVGTLAAGVLYIFVMPHLSGYVQLGGMIFVVTFLIYYLLWQSSQAVMKLGLTVQFLNVMGVQNQQTYDFAQYANSAAAVLLAGALAIAISYLPPSPRPEKAFLRLVRRFFRHSEYLLSRLSLDSGKTRGLLGWLRTLLYRANLLELTHSIATWGEKIDQRTFPANSPAQVRALTTALSALALRINALAQMRQVPQAEMLVRAMLDDVRAWRLVLQGQFQAWAADPNAGIALAADAEDRLRARLEKLELKVEEVFGSAPEGALSARDYESFYRLLGRYRGLSETGINYLRQAEGMNWGQLREARF